MRDLLQRGLLRRQAHIHHRPPVHFLWAASDRWARTGRRARGAAPPLDPEALPASGGRNATQCLALLWRQISDVFDDDCGYVQRMRDEYTCPDNI